jgi:hypothetical protein
MAQDRQKQRNQLIRQALQAAVQRVDRATKPDDAFAPIGELLFWIIAADDGLRKQYPKRYERFRRNHQHGLLFDGIRYVRNKVAHASGAWDYRAEDIVTERFWDSYDAWVWVRLPRPGKARNNKEQKRWKQQFAAYNKHLKDKAVLDTTMDAVDLLEEWWKQHGI